MQAHPTTPGTAARRKWTAQAEINELRKDTASLTGTILHLDGQRDKYEKAGDAGRAKLQEELIALNQRRIDANDERIAYLEGRS